MPLHGTTITPRTVLARGVLPALVKLGDANVGPPALSEKKLLWWSEASFQDGNRADQVVGFATRYRRLLLALETEIAGLITFESSADGVNYDFVQSVTYNPADVTTKLTSYFVLTPWIKVFFEDNTAAGPPTTWRFSLEGDESSGEPGA